MGVANPVGGSRPQPRVIPFGKYLLLQRLAVGGMAEVFLAKSFGIEGFEKIIAIKRILPTMAEDSDFIDMFIDEAKIAGQLSHANIAPIYELGKIGESHYIAMEYIWGKDLLQIMNRFRRMRKRMPPAMVAFVGGKMCEALDYAHQKRDRRGQPLNLIHRDMSPQNVLVSYEGSVKVIDFGIAKAASRTTKTQAGVLKGKFGYMSPEQVRGLPIDHRSDVFAVGTCLYEMLTSERLFVGESDFSTLEKVRSASVVPPSSMVKEIPPQLDAVIMKALARDPADRYSTAGALQEALLEFLATQRPPFTTSKLAQWMKTAFSDEFEKEKLRLDSFSQIGRPSVLGGGPQRRGPSRPGAPPPPRPMPRPVAPPKKPPADDPLAGLESFQDDSDFEGEATMITASPFDEMQDQANAAEPEEFEEQATQIFFSAEDLQEIPPEEHPAPVPGMPGRPPPAGVVPLVAPERPGSLMPGDGPRPAAGFDAPPLAAQPTPVTEGEQRRLPTMDMSAQDPAVAAALLAPPPSKKNSVAIFAAAAVVMLALGIGGAWLAFGGAKLGALEIRTSPEDAAAAVSVDGEEKGASPLRIEELPPGRRLVEVSADGYQPYARVVVVHENETLTMDIALTATAPAAAVAVAPTPAAPTTPTPAAPTTPTPVAPTTPTPVAPTTPVAAAPSMVAEPPSMVAAPPSMATHVASAMTGARPATMGPVQIPSMTTRISMSSRMATHVNSGMSSSMSARARGRGTLVINTMPWAHVFIDGRDTGRNTPIRSMRVPAGDHRIGLRTNDGTMHTVNVTVAPGQTVRVVRRL
ncbi:MAG: protein kinase [Deltaproteobacteria bacterium]|nr:protein kinase [Deltaproteobacteria bacterium]